jgi:tetratricopeptide (TPR) repeat protein
MSVSLCMIVRNESANLADALTSAQGLVDEVVIVDTGSTDNTRRIALDHGARVYDFPWCDDFAAARNESLRHASGEWIFWLDADDRISEGSRPKLHAVMGPLGAENAAYVMSVVSVGPDGRPDRQALQVRLFRNDPRIRWDYRVHEHIMPAVHRAGGELRSTDVAIVHTGYMSADLVAKKLQRNLRLLDLDLQSRPLDGHLLCCRASALLDMDRAPEALVALGLWETAHGQYTPPVPFRAMKARALAKEEELGAALECVRAGLGDYPGDSQLNFLESKVLAALGDLFAAEQMLRAQLALPEQHGRFAVADRTIMAFRARHLLSEMLLMQGRAREAALEAEQVTRARPGYGPAWLTLAEAAALLGDPETFDAVRRRFTGLPDAATIMAVLGVIQLRCSGDLAGALTVASGAPTPHPALTTLRAQLLFDKGVRGEPLDTALRQALANDPLCPRTWAIKRSCLARRGVFPPAFNLVSHPNLTRGTPWASES